MISCNLRNFALARSFKGGFCGFVSRFFFTTVHHPRTPSPLSRIPFFPTPHPVPKFSRIPLPVWRFNPVSRHGKFCFSRESHTVFGSTPGSREYLPDPEFLNRTPRDGSKLERNERFYNYYCSSSITLAISSV